MEDEYFDEDEEEIIDLVTTPDKKKDNGFLKFSIRRASSKNSNNFNAQKSVTTGSLHRDVESFASPQSLRVVSAGNSNAKPPPQPPHISSATLQQSQNAQKLQNEHKQIRRSVSALSVLSGGKKTLNFEDNTVSKSRQLSNLANNSNGSTGEQESKRMSDGKHHFSSTSSHLKSDPETEPASFSRAKSPSAVSFEESRLSLREREQRHSSSRRVLSPFTRQQRSDSTSMSRASSTILVYAGDHSFRYESGVELDPLILLYSMPLEISGRVWVRKMHRLLSHSKPFWAEVRGSMLLLFDSDLGQLASEQRSPSADGDSKKSQGALGVAPLLALCSLVGAQVSTRLEKNRSKRNAKSRSKPYMDRFLVISKTPHPSGTDGILEMRVPTEKWELVIANIASMRKVGINDFKVVGTLGSGSSGKVFAVRDRTTGEYLAMKVLKKDNVFDSALQYRSFCDERVALQLTHGFPFTVRLRYCFQTERRVYIITELCEGGDLQHYLHSKTEKSRLPEATVRRVSAEICLALEFLHSRGIVYRDLKPENVLLNADGHVQLADFGLCKQLDGGRFLGRTQSICGTFEFAAPEMLSASEPYGISVDIWSFGVLVYTMLRGTPPYGGENIEDVKQSIQNTPLRFSSSNSPEAVDLVRHLLDRNPDTRVGCDENGLLYALERHPFYADVNWSGIYEREEHPDGLQVFSVDEHERRFRPLRRRESLEKRISREIMEEQFVLPNFEPKDLDHIKVDPDQNDETYSDTSLWPLIQLGKHRIPDYVLVGNFYSKPKEATRCLV